MPNFEGNRVTKTILGNREHRKQISDFLGEQGNKPIYFRGTREQVPLGGSHLWHTGTELFQTIYEYSNNAVCSFTKAQSVSISKTL